MKPFFQNVIHALRSELHEYGGLLHLFQQQQQSVLRHDPEGFLNLNEEVDAQIDHVTQCRREREELVRQTALEIGSDPNTPLTGLLVHFPTELQPLLKALIQEINDLLHRTQRRIKQNHFLLGQCLELARQMVALTKPELSTGAYNARGKQSYGMSSYHSMQGIVA